MVELTMSYGCQMERPLFRVLMIILSGFGIVLQGDSREFLKITLLQ